MKKSKSTLFFIGMMIAGLALLLYPTLSDAWYSAQQARQIKAYIGSVEEQSGAENAALLAAARAYNETLVGRGNSRYTLTAEQAAEYDALLDPSGSGVMGYLEIPAIRCRLPICHGTDEAALQTGVGHIEGSSLPVGGQGTHAVLSGHRGLPSAKLLTDLDKLTEGDRFTITVLDETLTYEVDQILTVLPDELDALEIDPEKDYCTLVTCTPYGINSHRLLVRGHRVENAPAAEAEPASEGLPGWMIPAGPAAVLILAGAGLWVKKRNKSGRGD